MPYKFPTHIVISCCKKVIKNIIFPEIDRNKMLIYEGFLFLCKNFYGQAFFRNIISFECLMQAIWLPAYEVVKTNK